MFDKNLILCEITNKIQSMGLSYIYKMPQFYVYYIWIMDCGFRFILNPITFNIKGALNLKIAF